MQTHAPMVRPLRALIVILAGGLAACSSSAPPAPSNVHVGAAPATVPAEARANNASPVIQSIWFNSLDVKRGGSWQGRVDTSTNVASVEVRNNLFSINARRSSYGHFAFDVDVFDLPSIFIRGYDLRVIARNSAGAETEEDLPFRIR